MMKSVAYRTGIYFLMNDGEIVYIGKTTRYPKRLYYHYSQELPHNCVRFIPCAESRLDEYERRLIKIFKPLYNKALKPKGRRSKKIKQVWCHEGVNKRAMKFRVLTKKSFVGFGFFKDRTIDSMIKSGKTLDVIAMYFNLSHISFHEDLLAEFKITPDWRINKPGTDRDKLSQFLEAVYPEEYRIRYDAFVGKVRQGQRNALRANLNATYSKLHNRNYNQKK